MNGILPFGRPTRARFLLTTLRTLFQAALPVLLVGLLALPNGTSAADAIRIETVRTGVIPERTRLVLDLSAEGVTWRVSEQTPRGAVVLLAGVELASGARTQLDDVGRIRAGRLETEGGRGLRIALQFGEASALRIFTLADPPRWVLDVLPAASDSGAGTPTHPPVAGDAKEEGTQSVPGPAVADPEEAVPDRETTRPGEPSIAKPESAEPQIAEPETAKAETETVESQPGQPEAAKPESAEPQIAEPEAAKAETETVESQSGQPETAKAETETVESQPVQPDGARAAVEAPSSSDPSRPAETELLPQPERRGPRVVVIDPGHGGEDPGATGPGLREKDVCLDVARRLHRSLSSLAGVHPVLSRSRDVFVPLRQRMRLAEELEADLFVSIHVNAAEAANVQGVEVFFLSLRGASDEASREVARSENEALSATAGEPIESGDELPFTLSLRQSDTLLRSSRAAETVLDAFVERELAENRGVRQAAFVVLKSVQVPSILVELGFASSQIDRDKLKQEPHRQALADALAEGVDAYFRRFAPVRTKP